jgi:flagellar assembly protein FliH
METRQAEVTQQQEVQQQARLAKSEKELEDLRAQVRRDAVAETEMRLAKEYQARSEAESAKIREALERFQDERKGYFLRVESEIVSLALAISAKILHREAQVDPLLVTALVRVAIDKLHDGSNVSVRVPPEKAEKWRRCLANPLNGSTIAIVEDSHLTSDDCILESDLGSANFSIDAQLKEIEQGFFDLLAQRPSSK